MKDRVGQSGIRSSRLSTLDSRLSRRDFVRIGGGGLAALLASRWGSPIDALADVKAAPGRARACVLIWLNGGPSHIDTFDPKPGTRVGGPFKAIKTSAPGMQICEHLPQVAAQGHRLAVIRGMTSREGNHQRAQYLVHTGYAPNPTVEHPALGAWVSEELGDASFDLPHFVSLNGPSLGGGFLGLGHGPFIVPDAGRIPRNVATASNVDTVRFERRRGALEALEASFVAETHDPKITGRRMVYDKAVRMMHSTRLDAFDIESEPAGVKSAYGDTDFGRGCLTARRLVEAGVKFVEVVLDGWDTHKDNFERTKKLMATLDPAMATLMRELGERKLLDSTLVACMGEFGRTPRISGDDGRDHHPAAWSAVLAGGGIRGGIVHGATNDEGDKVADKPTSVPDLMATMAHALGMDPAKSFPTPLGRPISITDNGSAISTLVAG